MPDNVLLKSAIQFDVALVPNQRKHNIKNLYRNEGYFKDINNDFLIFLLFLLLFIPSKEINLFFFDSISSSSFKSFNSIPSFFLLF